MLQIMPVQQYFTQKLLGKWSVAKSRFLSPQLNTIAASPLEVIFVVESSEYLQ
jgi:hypothetical protein